MSSVIAKLQALKDTQTLIDTQHTLDGGDSKVTFKKLAKDAIATVAVGAKETIIGTTVPAGSAITVAFGGNTYTTLGTLLVLPGTAAGDVVITNTLASEVEITVIAVS